MEIIKWKPEKMPSSAFLIPSLLALLSALDSLQVKSGHARTRTHERVLRQ